MTQDAISQIPLDQLHESPFNPRKTFTDIDELATSILAEGRIHQPLLVRPIIIDDLARVDDTPAGYEVVFGHRRLRAAQRAGLASAPCMVRALSDAEARSAQIAENIARKDVHPIEEAEGFALMLKDDGVSREDLATKFGKSISYVHARLALLRATPALREARLRGDVDAEAALLVARLRTEKFQEKALARIKAVNADMADGGKASYRRIRAELAEMFTLKLKEAIFDREDDTLLPGAGACGAGPKRTGNAPEYQDLVDESTSRWRGYGTKHGDAQLCTDPDCWAAKKTAHLARKAAELQAAGKQVVNGNKARQAIGADGHLKGDYIPLDKVRGELKKVAAKAGAEAPKPVHVIDQRSGKVVQAVLRSELVTAGVMKPQPKAEKGSHRENYAEQTRRREEQQAIDDKKAKAETAHRMALFEAVRTAAVGRERTAFELRMVAAATLSGVDWHDRELIAQIHGAKGQDLLKKRIDSMEPAELTALILDCCIVDNVRVSPYRLDTEPGPLLALAAHYGIDPKAVQTPVAEEPADAAAAPATTPTPSKAGARKKAPKAAADAAQLRLDEEEAAEA